MAREDVSQGLPGRHLSDASGATAGAADPVALRAARLPILRDYIAALPAAKFNMGSYFGTLDDGSTFTADIRDYEGKTNAEILEGTCGSCACIAGHALVAFEPAAAAPSVVAERAAEVLGLTEDQAARLFEPNNYDEAFFGVGLSLSRVTQEHALRVLDHLIETGEVDWSVAVKAEA